MKGKSKIASMHLTGSLRRKMAQVVIWMPVDNQSMIGAVRHPPGMILVQLELTGPRGSTVAKTLSSATVWGKPKNPGFGVNPKPCKIWDCAVDIVTSVAGVPSVKPIVP